MARSSSRAGKMSSPSRGAASAIRSNISASKIARPGRPRTISSSDPVRATNALRAPAVG